MKKVLAVVLVVCVVFGAGAALAQQDSSSNQVREHRNQQAMNNPNMNRQRQQGDFQGRHMQFDSEGRRGSGRHCGDTRTFTPDMPKEIREKAADLAKLRVDLEEALSSRPVNKAKALEVHAKMQKLQNEIDTWRFSQRLDRSEEFQKQRELNKKAQDAPEK